MVKKIIAVGLVVFGLLVVSVGRVDAVRLPFGKVKPYQAAGNFKAGGMMDAIYSRFEEKLREQHTISRKDLWGPESTAMRLEVVEGGRVTGRGKVGPFGGTWYDDVSDRAKPAMGWKQGEYFIALSGEQKGVGLEGDAVLTFRTTIGLGHDPTRARWEAKVISNTTGGGTVKGTIFDVYRGADLPFELQMGEEVELEISDELMGEMEEELEKSGVVVTGDEERDPWNTNVLGMNNAYVIVDGKRESFVDGMELQPGMTLETEGEDGYLVFTTSSGEHIRLQGDGTRVTLMTTDTVEDGEWKEVLDQYTTRKRAITGARDLDKANPLRSRTPVTVMQSGQMVVKYESGGSSGWWNAAFRRDHLVDSGGNSVGFARNVYSDYTGETVKGIEDSDPVELAFENHSLVEYLYSDGEIEVKVYEGEAVGYRIDLKSGENKEVIRVKAGESVKILVDEYQAGSGKEGLVKGEFDLSQEPEGVKELKKLSQNKTSSLLLAGGGILGVLVILYIFKKKRKK